MQDRGNNVINNYKGVMLCSRPNQNQHVAVQKPFCGRVFNHDQVGLVPCKNQQSPTRQQKKIVPTILNKHKKWLHQFQQKQAKAKEQIQQKQKQSQQRFIKIKNMAEIDRDRSKKMKGQYNQTATNVMSILDEKNKSAARPAELNSANLRRLDEKNQQKDRYQSVVEEQVPKKNESNKAFRKKNKKQKPIWAMTEQQKEDKQQKQADQLISFFENAEIQQYSEDEQVREILNNLKDKIKTIKQSEDWKEKEAKKIQDEKQVRIKRKKERGQDVEDDKYSNFSVNSEAQSISSEKTQKKIQELRRKKNEDQEWDKHTTSSKHSYANMQEKIAKNLADQVLRSYPHLRGVHSNTSIRKMLQAQASKAINQPIQRPVITTIIKQPKPLDTNNLPYLHRNPAI